MKEWQQLHSVVEKKVTAKMTQTREKVSQQGVVETSHVKPKVDRSESGDEQPETNEAWFLRRQEEKARRRAR
jgi:hypothetical protein